MHLTVQNLWMGPWKRVVEPCAFPHPKAVHGRRKSRPTPVDRPRIPPGGAVHSLWKGAAVGPRKAVRSPWKTRAYTPEKLWIAGGKPAAKAQDLCKNRRRGDRMGSLAPGLARPGPVARRRSGNRCRNAVERRTTCCAPAVHRLWIARGKRPLRRLWRGHRGGSVSKIAVFAGADGGLSPRAPPAYWPARATACPLRITIMRWNLRALPSPSNDVTPAAPGKGFIAFM